MSSQDTPLAVRNFDDRPEDELVKSLDWDSHQDPDDQLAGEAAPKGPQAAAASWRAAKSLLKLRDQVNARFPGRKKDSDGTIGDAAHCGHAGATSDHCPSIHDGSVGVVTAIDITHDPAHGCDAGQLAEVIRVSHDPRVKYIISNRRIANFQALGGAAAWAWRPYNGANPHTAHVHVSVRPVNDGASSYDSTATWSIP
jgi:hypothetical protein